MIKRVICFSNPAYLSLRLNQLVVKLPEVEHAPNLPAIIKEESVRTIPIEDIGVVVLDNKQITISQAVMDALLSNNCALITCNDKHHPVGLQLPLDGHTLQNELFRKQIDASEPLKKQMWQQTIACKIAGQAYVLRSQQIDCPNMRAWAQQVRSGDADNMEGRAAAFYWKNLFHDPDFVRGQEEAPPNNLLNYGYAIVRAMMARSLVAAGLLPTLGIHHHNRYNAYCLADDIMEPYRPLVDMLVLDIMKEREDISTLSIEIKRDLLALSTMDVQIGGKRSPMMIAMQTTATSVQKCFTGEARKIIYPEW